MARTIWIGIKMAKTRNSAGINSGSRGASNVNPLYKAATSFSNYVGNVAREVRDVPTAIGTVIKNRQSGAEKLYKSSPFTPEGTGDIKNLKSQIKEVAKTALTGKKGTTSQKSTVVYRNDGKGNNASYTDLAKQRNNKKKK
jgi:hypothetical protein